MGFDLKCKCSRCKYEESSIFLGCGLSGGPNYWPGIDREAKRVQTFPILENTSSSNLYLNGNLNKVPVLGKVINIFRSRLTNWCGNQLVHHYNLCPFCRRHRLSFYEVGLWD